MTYNMFSGTLNPTHFTSRVFQPYDAALTAVNEAHRQYVTDDCLAALYIPLLLTHRLRLTNDSCVIHVPGTIAGQKPGKHHIRPCTDYIVDVFKDRDL